MLIDFGSKDVEKLCNESRVALKKHGKECARKLRNRLDDLAAARSLAPFRDLPGHCEELKGDRKGKLSLRLHGGMRLIFEPTANPPPTKQDGGLDWAKIDSITIVAIEDYHKG